MRATMREANIERGNGAELIWRPFWVPRFLWSATVSLVIRGCVLFDVYICISFNNISVLGVVSAFLAVYRIQAL